MTLKQLIHDLDLTYDLKVKVYESLEVSDTIGFQLVSGLLEAQLSELQEIIIRLKLIEKDMNEGNDDE
jgi:hypothetical protein